MSASSVKREISDEIIRCNSSMLLSVDAGEHVRSLQCRITRPRRFDACATRANGLTGMLTGDDNITLSGGTISYRSMSGQPGPLWLNFMLAN